MQTTSPDGLNHSMELLFNDRSVHGQFQDFSTFRVAIRHLMTIRNTVRQFGRELYCHRNVCNAQVMPGWTMPRAVQALRKEEQRVLMQWLTRHGPFWDDDREHSAGDWLECEGEIVTDSAVGEAAYCLLSGIERGLVSMRPSAWLRSPLNVVWRDNGHSRNAAVRNYWDADVLKAALAIAPVPIESWTDLASEALMRCPNLMFADNAFDPLGGVPFGKGAADRLLQRLVVLHDLKGAFNQRGERTSEGHQIYEMHFTGRKSWFSDSSAAEKTDFEEKLTFPHPAKPGEFLFCTWHGKVKTPQLRIHYSWTMRANDPAYVVYVGQKITRR